MITQDRIPSGAVARSAPPTRKPWVAPRLVRMGSVASLTAKRDMAGKTDGGFLFKSKT